MFRPHENKPDYNYLHTSVNLEGYSSGFPSYYYIILKDVYKKRKFLAHVPEDNQGHVTS